MNKDTPRLTPSIRRKMLLLLDMEYRPAELAEELVVNPKTIASYLAAGLPARKDAQGHIWINGIVYCDWGKNVLSTYEKRKKVSENEFYCVACRGIVTVKNHSRRKSGTHDILKATCPDCKRTVNKFARSK